MMRWRIMSVLHPEQSIFKSKEEPAAWDKSNCTNRDMEQPTPVATPDDEVQDVMPVSDLPGATISPADLMLMKVYGDYLHQNDGTHLDGGIKEDGTWQERWRKLIALPTQHYDAPNGTMGHRFVRILTEELESIPIGTLSSLSDGDGSALTRGEDIFSHQMKTDHENRLMGSRKIYNVSTGYRADHSGTPYPGPGHGDARPKG
jgi:hypothetical protein